MTKTKVTVIIPDLHAPIHDPAAVAWALAQIKQRQPSSVIFLGDFMDFLALSRYPKGPKQSASLMRELAIGRSIMRRFEEVIPRSARVTFIHGNHEARRMKYLWARAPELADLPELTVPRLLELPATWKIVPYFGSVIDQGVMVFHGQRFGKTVGLQNLADLGMSCVQGHSHRASLVVRRLANGKTLTAVEAGCLCKFAVGYTGVTNWTHAIAVIEDGRLELVRR